MDRKLREDVMAIVERAVTAAMLRVGERWLTADELCKQFGMFTKDWLEHYGDILPRKRISITTLDGKTRSTRWAYPQHEIAENLRNGCYNDLKLLR